MGQKINTVIIILIWFLTITGNNAQVYVSDLGNGYFQNPIIHADYSDPDVVRVGEDFYMVSSSFNAVPGLPILHSKDLVNWEIINHVLPTLIPEDFFNDPQHGNGVWAPSIRYHDGEFYVFYGDPDFGIYMIKTKDPHGKWNAPVLVKAAKGWIDPCPLWDEDGKAYLVHAFAGSRAGNKSILVVHEMAADGSRLLDDGILVFDGHETHPTIEGPKFYKRNGYYYIFAPAGGVKEGWQSVLRSKNPFGPYEIKDVMHQGTTDINGPHQGAWVHLENGEDWFVHFQDKDAYGRIVHLQPAFWKEDWIVIGIDEDGDGIGEPVTTYKKPNVGQSYPIKVPQTSDEFDTPKLGLQWQWHGNPQDLWVFPTNMGFLRMNPVIIPENHKNLWDAPNLLLQKFPAETFNATVKLKFHHLNDSEELGLIIMGLDYAYISLLQEDGKLILTFAECIAADKGSQEKVLLKKPIAQNEVYLKVSVAENAISTFSYSLDGLNFEELPFNFKAKEGKWIGAKTGLFFIRERHENNGGYANIEWFRITNE